MGYDVGEGTKGFMGDKYERYENYGQTNVMNEGFEGEIGEHGRAWEGEGDEREMIFLIITSSWYFTLISFIRTTVFLLTLTIMLATISSAYGCCYEGLLVLLDGPGPNS